MPRGFGLAVALCAAILAPVAVMSAPKEAGVSEQARKQGMAEAPAVVQAAGLPCQVTDARLVGKVGADKKKGTPAQTFYEVACQGGMGFLLQANEGGPTTSYSCIEADFPPDGSKPSAPCMLPGNMNPLAALQPALQKAGVQCLPEKARGVGQTKTSTYMEVACQGGTGFIMVTSAPFDASKPVQAQNCLMYDEAETNIKCTLTDKAARLAVVDKYAQTASCAVKDRRFVGMSKDNSTFYEASCQDGKGYIFKTDGSGALKETYECSKATQILGGCTLTDARQAQSEQAGLYTKLVTEAGGKCDVDKYALFPTTKPGSEVVELVCKDGSGAILMSQVGQKSQLLDCGRAPVAGYKCSMSKPELGFAALTADLKKFNFNSCEVSNSRVVGKTDKGTTYVEVACADKLKGYMIEYQSTPKVAAVKAIGCAFAGNCKLPGNT
jgi:hypothetical protein